MSLSNIDFNDPLTKAIVKRKCEKSLLFLVASPTVVSTGPRTAILSTVGKLVLLGVDEV
jgi:hypothetical protein